MILPFLSFLFFFIGFILAYRLWLAPLLRSRPSFAEFYRLTDSFWKSVWLKVAFLKTKLTAALVMMASALLGVHDFLLPVATGIDWTPLWEKVPSWAWPCLSFAIGALFYWLRHVTAKEQDQVVAAVQAGVPPAQAVLLVATEPQPEAPSISG
jgi:hypothetical protein